MRVTVLRGLRGEQASGLKQNTYLNLQLIATRYHGDKMWGFFLFQVETRLLCKAVPLVPIKHDRPKGTFGLRSH